MDGCGAYGCAGAGGAAQPIHRTASQTRTRCMGRGRFKAVSVLEHLGVRVHRPPYSVADHAPRDVQTFCVESLFDESVFDNPLSLPGFSPLEKGERSVDRGGSIKRMDETYAYPVHQTGSERFTSAVSVPRARGASHAFAALHGDLALGAVEGALNHIAVSIQQFQLEHVRARL